MPKSANGSTITFGSEIAQARSITAVVNGNPIDVTTLASALHEYEVGIEDIEITVECVGQPSIDVGDIDTMSIDWNAGGTDTFDSQAFVVTNTEDNGELDSEHTTSITFQPSATAAGT